MRPLRDDSSRPEVIDPGTFHMEGPHGSLVDHLRASLKLAREAAGKTRMAILLYLEDHHGEPHIKFHKVPLQQLLDEATYPCPRAADEAFQKETGFPRPVPSALVYPDGRVVVSKPSLCSGCTHYLTKQVRGSCYGLAYAPLFDTYEELAA